MKNIKSYLSFNEDLSSNLRISYKKILPDLLIGYLSGTVTLSSFIDWFDIDNEYDIQKILSNCKEKLKIENIDIANQKKLTLRKKQLMKDIIDNTTEQLLTLLEINSYKK
jgi:hypothetical protein